MGVPAHPPADMEIALICEKFNVLPSQILKEDVRHMRRILALIGEFNRIRNQRKKHGYGRRGH